MRELDIHGLKYLRAFEEILTPLAELPAHGNRRFFLDQYVSLLLLHFFNPVLSSLRSLQQATGLENVQKTLGVKRTSWGAMSESAGHVFDPEGLRLILGTIFQRTLQLVASATNGLPIDARHLRQELVAAATDSHRLRRHKPPPLIFIQTTHQQYGLAIFDTVME